MAADKYGVINRDRKFIIAPRFDSIKYLGNGLYLCSNNTNLRIEKQQESKPSIDKAVPEKKRDYIRERAESQVVILKNRGGQDVPVNLPVGCTLVDVILPYNSVPSKQTAKTLKPATLVKFLGKNGFGLCDGSGKVLLPPKYSRIERDTCWVRFWTGDSDKEKGNVLEL